MGGKEYCILCYNLITKGLGRFCNTTCRASYLKKWKNYPAIIEGK